MTVKDSQTEYPLQYIKGIGPLRAEALAKEGIITFRDVLFNFPRSYIDRNAGMSLNSLAINLAMNDVSSGKISYDSFKIRNEVTIVAVVKEIKEHTFGKGRKFLKLKSKTAVWAKAK
jgi:RecG-like helicase